MDLLSGSTLDSDISKKVKLYLWLAMEAHKVVRRRGSHISR
jgi:hypothetical protein